LQTAVTNFNTASSWFDNSLRTQVERVKSLGINTAEDPEELAEIDPQVREVKKWDQ
jgi:hypothetical protein